VTDGPALSPAARAGLARFLERPQRPRAGERCELCAAPIGEPHSHVANLETRAIMCACRPCWLLFTRSGAAAGRYQAVPERYLYDPAFALSDAQWDTLQIPVRIAFFFHNSQLGRVAAFYPSPAGATESLLDLGTWDQIAGANPLLTGIEPDVEGLIVRRTSGGYECYLVPIDACYELVGRVKLHWKGFDGGEEAWAQIDGFFDALRERSLLPERPGRPEATG
jgi:hypothetical protein